MEDIGLDKMFNFTEQNQRDKLFCLLQEPIRCQPNYLVAIRGLAQGWLVGRVVATGGRVGEVGGGRVGLCVLR